MKGVIISAIIGLIIGIYFDAAILSPFITATNSAMPCPSGNLGTSCENLKLMLYLLPPVVGLAGLVGFLKKVGVIELR